HRLGSITGGDCHIMGFGPDIDAGGMAVGGRPWRRPCGLGTGLFLLAWGHGPLHKRRGRRSAAGAGAAGVKIPAASGGALEGRSLLCWGNLSPKPPNKDAIPPHRKQGGILASFRDGQKYGVAVESLNANYSFKYLGQDAGVSAYTFIDERNFLWHHEVI